MICSIKIVRSSIPTTMKIVHFNESDETKALCDLAAAVFGEPFKREDFGILILQQMTLERRIIHRRIAAFWLDVELTLPLNFVMPPRITLRDDRLSGIPEPVYTNEYLRGDLFLDPVAMGRFLDRKISALNQEIQTFFRSYGSKQLHALIEERNRLTHLFDLNQQKIDQMKTAEDRQLEWHNWTIENFQKKLDEIGKKFLEEVNGKF